MSPFGIFLTLVLAFSKPIAAQNCRQGCKDVYDNFSLCVDFIEGQGTDPTPICCQKVAKLNAISQQEKGGAMRICRCIEYFATYRTNRPFVASRIQDLPLKCNTHLSFPISERMNCSRYMYT